MSIIGLLLLLHKTDHLIRYCKKHPRHDQVGGCEISGDPRKSTTGAKPRTRLKVQIRGRLVQALLDSGTVWSVVPASWISPEEVMKWKAVLRVMNGTFLHVIGETVLKGQVESYQFDEPCLVTEVFENSSLV